MQKSYIHRNIDLAAALLCYGLFSVLCHSCAVLFFLFVNPKSLPTPYLHRYCIGMLEYCIMSITLLLGGALLVRRTSCEIGQNKK